jgi:hypothetical protein
VACQSRCTRRAASRRLTVRRRGRTSNPGPGGTPTPAPGQNDDGRAEFDRRVRGQRFSLRRSGGNDPELSFTEDITFDFCADGRLRTERVFVSPAAGNEREADEGTWRVHDVQERTAGGIFGNLAVTSAASGQSGFLPVGISADGTGFVIRNGERQLARVEPTSCA